MQKLHTIWIWKDAKGVVKYVGYGRFGDFHPAIVRWEDRHFDGSELGFWLRDYAVEPTRERYGARLVTRGMARAAVAGLRAKHADTILRDRDPKTWKGGGESRSVYYFDEANLENCRVFDSVRQAANERGVNASTITRWAQNASNTAWGYFED